MLSTDQRQRAPFAHKSSCASLTTTQLSALRSPFPSQSHWPIPPSPESHQLPLTSDRSIWAQYPFPRKINNETCQAGFSDHPYALGGVGATYSLDTPPSRRHSLPSLFNPNTHRRAFTFPSMSLPNPATVRFISLCFLWYACSAISNNTGKVILNHFKYPVTLTIVQFFFVAFYCAISSQKMLGWSGRLRQPTRNILKGTLPLAAFQVGGHIFGSMAISRVPVSTVHTIKALSPLFTVMAYALLFGVSYSPATYLSLLPLTLGVMLACSFDISFSNIFGLVCALGSTIVFVSQNIFFKKIMPTTSTNEVNSSSKLDKINLLYFSSSMAFILMIPLWIYSDARRLLDLWINPAASESGTSVLFYFFLNGTVHFAQSIIAFALLASTSPVTYSIASLVKRIAVICLAIVWFKQPVHTVQALGIALTGAGLWMYNNAKRDVDRGELKMRHIEALREGVLPSTKMDPCILEGSGVELSYKSAHNSPKPMYPNNYIDLPSSTTTAVNKTTFQIPSTLDHTSHIEAPYPSPPASTSSSPPSDITYLGISKGRQHRLPSEGERFRPPVLNSIRSSVMEETRETGVNEGIAAVVTS
ncbi:solute carrier family 35, member E1 [Cryptococcus neoformans]|nr:solute carrier family 35, member E1 [Cryptococcus neoformans var. grubii c45]OXB36427.1 solute carrier family 35, member E1 [Cryptococcus neoformans var. grubii]OXC60623.1 solute carrier family 35, member E1 [Cryptococcus neoformans var. grubii MW-RSA852]